MELLSLVLAVLALAVGLLALRRADVVGRRAKQPRPEAAGGTPGSPSSDGDSRDGVSQDGEVLVRGADSRRDSEPGRRGMRLLGRGHADPNAELIDRIDRLEGELMDRISRVEVVRYDAFEGAGGQLSFSLAMLDDRGNGLILTSIHAPSETRTYVKEIPLPDDPLLPSELSPEEREVLRRASAGISRRNRDGEFDD